MHKIVFYNLDDSKKQKFRIVRLERGDFRIEMVDDRRDRRLEEGKDLRKEERDERLRKDDLDESDDRDERDERDECDDRRKDRDDREKVRNEKSKTRVLDIENGSRKDDSMIVQWKLTGERSQRFRLIAVERKSKL